MIGTKAHKLFPVVGWEPGCKFASDHHYTKCFLNQTECDILWHMQKKQSFLQPKQNVPQRKEIDKEKKFIYK